MPSSGRKRQNRRHKKSSRKSIINNFSYKGLCLSSGGYKGFAMLGALTILKIEKYLNELKMFSGCSIGSIITTLMSIGWTPIEIFKKAINIKIFKGFEDIDFEGIKENFSIMSNKSLVEALEDMILEKRSTIPTLLELYEEGIYISYSVCDRLSKKEYKVDWKSSPNILISDGAMWSANMPGVFPPIPIDGMQLVDGALTNPFPVDYIDNGEKILGICVYGQTSDDTRSPVSYAIGSIMVPIEQLQRRSIETSSKNCHILELFVNDHDVLDTSDAHGSKSQMFFNGLHDGKIFIKALRKNKRRRIPTPKLRTPINIFPDNLILKCMISQPYDILCQASLTSPESIIKNVDSLSPEKIDRIKSLAKIILKDEIDDMNKLLNEALDKNKPNVTYHYSKDEDNNNNKDRHKLNKHSGDRNIDVKINYSQHIYDGLPIELKSMAKFVIDSLGPENARKTVTGINIIFEGLEQLGLNVLGNSRIKYPSVIEVDEEVKVEEIDYR